MKAAVSAALRAKEARIIAGRLDSFTTPLMSGYEVRKPLNIRPGAYPPYANSVHMAADRDEQARLVVEGYGGD